MISSEGLMDGMLDKFIPPEGTAEVGTLEGVGEGTVVGC